MGAFAADLRHAVRTLRRTPAFALTVVGVLGVGVALTTVAFAVVDGVLFKPLPFPRAHELHVVRAVPAGEPRGNPAPVSGREIRAWQTAVPDLRLAVVSPDGGVDEAFFDVLGIRPLLGGFTPEDFEWLAISRRTGRRITPRLLTYRRWIHEYGADPDVVGRTIIHADRSGFVSGFRIAGVLPEEFVFPLDAGTAQPDSVSPIPQDFRDTDQREYYAIARVARPEEVTGLGGRLTAASQARPPARPVPGHAPARDERIDRAELVPITGHLARRERPAFTLVFAGAGLLLLLGCVNVAGLLAARQLERRRELAVRRALGAPSWALARGLFAEMLLLSAAATAGALLVARPLLVWTIDLLPAGVVLLKVPAIDARVFATAALLATCTAALVACWPAWLDGRLSIQGALGRLDASATRPARRSAGMLIAAQLTLGFVLVTAGALSITSLATAWGNEAGFERHRMIVVETFVTHSPDARDTMDRLEALPGILRGLDGVDRVALSTWNPLFGRRWNTWTSVWPEGWRGEPDGVVSRRVSAEFFEVMRLRLVGGRWPEPGEWRGAHLAVVSETAARTFWPGRSPIGQTLVGRSPRDATRATVIAVVADARYVALDEDPLGDIYLPDPIAPGRYALNVHVRTTRDARGVLPSVRAALAGRGLDVSAATHEDALFATIRHRALPAWLFGSLGSGALVVLGAGIFGLLAMSTAHRTREMGVRIALGATAGRIVGLLLREQLVPVAAGLAAGALASAWTVRYLESQLYAVRAYDAGVWMSAAATLAGIAVLATLVPSWRAARVDPVQALRAE